MIGGGATDQFGGLHGMLAAAPPESEEGSNPPGRARYRLAMFADEERWQIVRALGWGELLVVCCRAQARVWLCRCKGATLRSRCTLVAPAL